jgi:hypothetical protein
MPFEKTVWVAILRAVVYGWVFIWGRGGGGCFWVVDGRAGSITWESGDEKSFDHRRYGAGKVEYQILESSV